MEFYTDSQLLLCNKAELINYIIDLREEGLKTGIKQRNNFTDRCKLQKENKQFKKENEELKNKFEVIEQSTESSAYMEEEIMKLKEDIAKMRKGLWIGADNRKTTLGKLDKEIDGLKKENEELKKRDEDAMKLSMKQNENFMNELESKEHSKDKIKEELAISKKYINELKHELTMKEHFSDCYNSYNDPQAEWEYPDKDGVDDYTDDLDVRKRLYEEYSIDEDIIVKGTITLSDDTESPVRVIPFDRTITCQQFIDDDFMDNIDDNLNLLAGIDTDGFDIEMDIHTYS